ICTQWLSSSLMLISPSGSNRTYSYSLRAGMVHAPSFFTFAAHEVRRLKSRSVAVMVSRSPAASNKKFDRMGMVVLRSTTPWVAVSSFRRSDLVTVISMAGASLSANTQQCEKKDTAAQTGAKFSPNLYQIQADGNTPARRSQVWDVENFLICG